jgi:pimeloyl-ACP methyl ester carboxylesterase
VAGIVAIDPTSDEGAPLPGFVASLPYRFFQVLGQVGAVRLLGRQIVQIQGGATPPPAVADAIPFLYGSKAMGTAANEIGDAGKSAEIVQGTRSVRLDGLPLAVITSGADRQHHQWLADQSDRGRLIDAEGAGHYVHYSEPDLVTRTILEVVEESRRP